MENKKCSRAIYGAFLILVFLFFAIFFTRVHPLILFDGDDWNYISYSRNAVPMGNRWNPTRILPETLMPLCGYIAAYIVAPLTQNYVLSVTVVCAVVVSVVITLYLYLFARAMENVFRLSKPQVMMIAALFLLAHFWVLRSEMRGNMHLFLAADLTCYFYYTIPTLLNAGCVLLFEADKDFWKKTGDIGKGLLLLAVYLLICSNLFSSIVLAVYAGVTLLLDCVVPSIREKSASAWKKNLRENGVFLGIIAGWLVSLALEAQGGRANAMGTSLSAESGEKVWSLFLDTLSQMNRYFMVFFAAVAAVSIVLLVVSRRRAPEDRLFCRKVCTYVLCAGATALYLLLLCSVGGLTWYITRADVLLAFFFYALLILVLCGIYVIKKLPRFATFLPVLSFIILFNCNTEGKTFRDAYYQADRFESETVYAITMNAYDRITEACRNGETEIVIYVPEFGGNNWPLSSYTAGRMSLTLYEHSQIEYPITVEMVPNDELCEASGLLRR